MPTLTLASFVSSVHSHEHRFSIYTINLFTVGAGFLSLFPFASKAITWHLLWASMPNVGVFCHLTAAHLNEYKIKKRFTEPLYLSLDSCVAFIPFVECVSQSDAIPCHQINSTIFTICIIRTMVRCHHVYIYVYLNI